LRREAAAAESAARPVPKRTTVIGSGISAGGTGVGGGVTVCGGCRVSVGPGSVAVGGTDVFVAVGGTDVFVAVGGTGVFVAVGKVGCEVGVSAANGAASTAGTAKFPKDMMANERTKNTAAIK